MGLSASQSRFLQLTARRSDNEYQAQQINHARTAVAEKMQEISLKYTEGINNRRLMFLSPVGDGSNAVKSTRLTYSNITAAYPEGLGYTLITKNGVEVRPTSLEASKMVEQAEENLAIAKNTKFLKMNATNDDGSMTVTEIDGSNFLNILDDYEVKQGDKGLNKYSMAQEVQGMNSLQFAQYWEKNGLSLQRVKNLEAKQNVTYEIDQDKIANAEANLAAARERLTKADEESFHYDDRCMDPDFLQQQLRSGEWTLQRREYNDLEPGQEYKNVQVHYGSISTVADELDTDDDNAYIREYNTQMDYYQHKDKQLELDLQQLQTSHNALQTEIDSVKKVIETNVEKSFKTFG